MYRRILVDRTRTEINHAGDINHMIEHSRSQDLRISHWYDPTHCLRYGSTCTLQQGLLFDDVVAPRWSRQPPCPGRPRRRRLSPKATLALCLRSLLLLRLLPKLPQLKLVQR